MTTTTRTISPVVARTGRDGARSRAVPWLALGVLAGPVFLAASLVQALLRPGFHMSRDAVSLLSLGHLGWIQDLNFAIAGVLSLVGAIAARRAIGDTTGGTWIPRLLGVVGVGTAAASVFHPDPSGGFPPGTASGASATSNWHGVLHMVCGSAAFLALIAACFVFARRLTRQGKRKQAICCRAAAVIFAICQASSGGQGGPEFLFVGVSVGWLCVSACIIGLIRELRPRSSQSTGSSLIAPDASFPYLAKQ